MSEIRTVLFDLDGTLADTAPDMAHALNLLLQEQGRAPLAYDAIRPHVSHGAAALVRLGFPAEAERFEALRQRFLAIYAENLCRETRLFPGVSQLLPALAQRGRNWGIVTNKPRYLAEPLLAQLGLLPVPACVVCGDSLRNRKPHPEPMLHACARAGSAPGQCVYVGDAERDIQAGRQAGMKTMVALFGYIPEDEHPEQWGADALIRAPMEVIDWLEAHD